MERGELVPDEVVIGIAEARLAQDDTRDGFILDGFPRTVAQAEVLGQILDRSGFRLERCVAMTVDEDAIVRRLIKRAQIEGRKDDNEATIRERMRVYREQTAPLIAWYRARGILAEVDGMGSVDEVGRCIEEALKT
jgi:adenylate kinase